MAKLPIDADILPPSDDHIFKTLLTHPEAKPILMSVVSTVIERPVVDVQIRNIEPYITDINEKSERFDVNCSVDGGDQIDVEMHSSPSEEIGTERKNFINKYIYYLADLHSSQKSKGVKYIDLVRTYQVTFCGYTVFPMRIDFANRFSLRSSDGEQLSDQINIVIIELSKLNNVLMKPVEKMTAFEMWSLFFRFAPDLEHRNLINNIIDVKEEISMASALLQEISKDERERAVFRSRRMAETDRTSDLLTAETRGMIKAFELIEKGVPSAEAKKILGLEK